MKKQLKKKLKNLLREILLFRIEYFVTPLFVVLFILSVKYVGFFCTRDIIFNIFVFFTIPACFIALRLTRKMLYIVYFGKVKYENK